MLPALVLAVLLLAIPVSAAPPSSAAPIQVTYEQYAWQNRCPPDWQDCEDPLCLNEDDILRWQARGDLGPGESFTYTPVYPSCQYRVTWGTFVFKGAKGNDHPAIEVEVTSTSCLSGCSVYHDDGVLYRSVYDCFIGKPCWKGTWCATYSAASEWPYMGRGHGTFDVTIRNVGTTGAVNVYLAGEDDSSWLHAC